MSMRIPLAVAFILGTCLIATYDKNSQQSRLPYVEQSMDSSKRYDALYMECLKLRPRHDPATCQKTAKKIVFGD